MDNSLPLRVHNRATEQGATNAQLAPVQRESSAESFSGSKWILSRELDLLLCCGGLVWILFVFQVFAIEVAGSMFLSDVLAMFATIGAHAFGETHIAATLFILYGTRLFGQAAVRRSGPRVPERSKNSFVVQSIYLPVVGALVCLSGLLIQGVTGILLKIYLLWVVQHFIAQAYGIALIYCHKHSYQLQRIEKQSFQFLLNSMAAVVIIRQLTDERWSTSNMLGIEIPFWGPLPAAVYEAAVLALQCGTVLFCALIVAKFVRERRSFPLPAMLLVVTIVATFLLPHVWSDLLLLYVPPFFHGTQYLAVTLSRHIRDHNNSVAPEVEMEVPGAEVGSNVSQVVKEQRTDTGARVNFQVRKMCSRAASLRQLVLSYFASLLVLSVVLYVCVPGLLMVGGYSWQVAFANVFCVVNLHHFLTDMAIWRSSKSARNCPRYSFVSLWRRSKSPTNSVSVYCGKR